MCVGNSIRPRNAAESMRNDRPDLDSGFSLEKRIFIQLLKDNLSKQLSLSLCRLVPLVCGRVPLCVCMCVCVCVCGTRRSHANSLGSSVTIVTDEYKVKSRVKVMINCEKATSEKS